jgi:Zn-dependent peptidase ImmA (M78 family)/DNA-binding XRE family transcriptional regulator
LEGPLSENRFNADMLKLARDAREFTQADLANAAGVTQALVSKIENGLITQPSDDVVDQLAKAVKFPREFFYQAERIVGFPHFHYRKRAKLGTKALAHIGALINIRRQHVAKLLRSCESAPAKPIPQIDLDEKGLTPEKVAEQLRAYWMLPRGPISNVVDLIEQAGGIVILCRFKTALLDGISFRAEGLPPLFFMNRDVPGDRFRFSLAHELGHMVLHAIPDDDGKMEDQAHRFAAAFLMPATEIKPYLATPKLSTFARVKAYWKVSIKALIKRASDLKLITDSQYRWLNVQYSRTYKAGEPVPIEREQPWRLRAMVEYHLRELGYSIPDLARFLCVNSEDLQRAYVQQRPGIRLVVSN